MVKEEDPPEERFIDLLFQHDAGTAAKILSPSELDMYSEYLAESPSRFSKTGIFIEYKEMHNKRNQRIIKRDKDKLHFKK